MNVSIQNLTKKFGETLALGDVSLEIRAQELFFLLGPSGCGKTTLLRLIAGFYQPDGGSLRIGDKPMNGIPPHQRNTGMVFQNYALWPHLSVSGNVAYGLEVRSVSPAERKHRVAEALAIVQMESYADRMPNQLSGGQQQRVALARALVIRPDVLLLDEPLSNLDAKLRLEMREEIRRIHRQTKITTIYVTHDQKEALSLADRMAVLRDGRIEQLGDPRTVYRSPANRFVADFMSETNWLAARVTGLTPNGLSLESEAGLFETARVLDAAIGTEVWLGFRPEAVAIGPAEVNSMPAKVVHVSYLGEVESYELEVRKGQKIRAIEQNPAHIREVGASLNINVRPQDCIVLART